jgi:NADH-quinone oxidoreductase subunit N
MPAYSLEIIVVVLGLILLLADAFMSRRQKASFAKLAIAGLLVVFFMLFIVDRNNGNPIWGIYLTDSWAFFYKGIALLSTILVLVMSIDFAPVMRQYTATNDDTHAGLGEFYALPVFTCAGLMWMASAGDMITIFVALELVTISFYVLVTYMRRNVGSLEAGVKYLILGALSTGFLVYGITWVFGVTGEFNLVAIGEKLKDSGEMKPAVLFAFALILIALSFKIAAVPFQIWVPDVYQGAPMPITAFLSVASKAAGFIVLLRVVTPFITAAPIQGTITAVLAVVACATIIYGNLAAIPQTNVKRLLAYSSISHAGFLLIAVAAMGSDVVIKGQGAWETVSFYLATYLLMTLLVFLVMTVVRVQTGGESLNAIKGLGKRNPFLAFAMLIGVASLAGIPLTAGFFGKFFVFNIAVQTKMYWPLAIAIFGAAAGFYYYFKLIKAMYWEQAAEDAPAIESGGLLSKIAIVVLLVAVIVFGFAPGPILSLLG